MGVVNKIRASSTMTAPSPCSPILFNILLGAAHGRSDLPESIQAVGRAMRDASVILAANDCSQEELTMWVNGCRGSPYTVCADLGQA